MTIMTQVVLALIMNLMMSFVHVQQHGTELVQLSLYTL